MRAVRDGASRSGKKPSGPARIPYGPHTGISSIARARCERKQLCCYINLDLSFKMSNVPNFVTRKKENKRKKVERGGHIIKCFLTELGRAGRENIWHSVNKYIILHVLIEYDGLNLTSHTLIYFQVVQKIGW